MSCLARSSVQLLVTALLVGTPGGLQGQERVRLQGRLVEAGTELGLTSGWVDVEGGPRVDAGADGGFRVEGLAPGDYVVRAGAYGYSERRIEFSLSSDTTVLIALEPAPLPLDSLLVQGGTVALRGEVVERPTGRGMIDAAVTVEGRAPIRTDVAGRFATDVPAGPPVRLTVRHFGYLPVRVVFATVRDTSLVVGLEPDPAVGQMIEMQVGRLERRARPLRSTTMPAIGRDFVVSRGNATAMDLVIERYGRRADRIDCLVIDEEQQAGWSDVARAGGGRSIGWGGADNSGTVLEPLIHMLAPEIERMEVLEFGHLPTRQMLRVYTRDFIRSMVARAGAVELVAPRIIPPNSASGEPLCR